jgi:hypothetical protein
MRADAIDALNAQGLSDFYDRDGQPIGLGSWVGFQEDDDYKMVAVTIFPRRDGRAVTWVSTVWTGMAGVGPIFGHPPMSFETMVFTSDGSFPWEVWDWQLRYPTEAHAHLGHEATVRMVLRALKPTWPSLGASCAAVVASGVTAGLVAHFL